MTKCIRANDRLGTLTSFMSIPFLLIATHLLCGVFYEDFDDVTVKRLYYGPGGNDSVTVWPDDD